MARLPRLDALRQELPAEFLDPHCVLCGLSLWFPQLRQAHFAHRIPGDLQTRLEEESLLVSGLKGMRAMGWELFLHRSDHELDLWLRSRPSAMHRASFSPFTETLVVEEEEPQDLLKLKSSLKDLKDLKEWLYACLAWQVSPGKVQGFTAHFPVLSLWDFLSIPWAEWCGVFPFLAFLLEDLLQKEKLALPARPIVNRANDLLDFLEKKEFSSRFGEIQESLGSLPLWAGRRESLRSAKSLAFSLGLFEEFEGYASDEVLSLHKMKKWEEELLLEPGIFAEGWFRGGLIRDFSEDWITVYLCLWMRLRVVFQEPGNLLPVLNQISEDIRAFEVFLSHHTPDLNQFGAWLRRELKHPRQL